MKREFKCDRTKWRPVTQRQQEKAALVDLEDREPEAAGASLQSSEALTHQLPSHADDLQ